MNRFHNAGKIASSHIPESRSIDEVDISLAEAERALHESESAAERLAATKEHRAALIRDLADHMHRHYFANIPHQPEFGAQKKLREIARFMVEHKKVTKPVDVDPFVRNIIVQTRKRSRGGRLSSLDQVWLAVHNAKVF